MLPNTANDLAVFLEQLEQVQGQHIDLSLARMQKAARDLDLLPFPLPVITVGGTNGKGSVVCALEHIYTAAGYQVGSYTSPHLFIFNERIKINCKMQDDESILAALVATQICARTHALTYFEVITLAALWLFKHASLDLLILEVGLGGRLDAVNIIDPMLSIITNIDLDHTDRLGSTRDAIAFEKAGIFRALTPIICGDENPPEVLHSHAAQLSAPFYCINQAFHYQRRKTGWDWHDDHKTISDLPYNGLLIENLSVAVAAIMQLQNHFPVTDDAIKAGLKQSHLPGRQQIVHHPCKQLFDVAHNPAGLKQLAKRIQNERQQGRVLLVFSMLADKDLAASCAEMTGVIDEWFIAKLDNERAATAEQLQSALKAVQVDAIQSFENIFNAYQAALNSALAEDLIVVAGSFYTVAALLPELLHRNIAGDSSSKTSATLR